MMIGVLCLIAAAVIAWLPIIHAPGWLPLLCLAVGVVVIVLAVRRTKLFVASDQVEAQVRVHVQWYLAWCLPCGHSDFARSDLEIRVVSAADGSDEDGRRHRIDWGLKLIQGATAAGAAPWLATGYSNYVEANRVKKKIDGFLAKDE